MCDAHEAKCDMVGLNTLKKPFTSILREEDNKIDNHRLSLRIVPLGKGDVNTRETTPYYTP